MSTKSPSGFALITVRSFQASAAFSDDSEFRAAYPGPVILLPVPSVLDDDDDDALARAPKPTRSVNTDSLVGFQPWPRERYHDAAIVPIGSSRPEGDVVVHVGRAAENDISIPATTVSNNHGRFTLRPDGSCSYTDLGSTNGSRVGGLLVPPNTEVAIEDGTEIVLGTDIRVLFLEPAGLRTLAASL